MDQTLDRSEARFTQVEEDGGKRQRVAAERNQVPGSKVNPMAFAHSKEVRSRPEATQLLLIPGKVKPGMSHLAKPDRYIGAPYADCYEDSKP